MTLIFNAYLETLCTFFSVLSGSDSLYAANYLN